MSTQAEENEILRYFPEMTHAEEMVAFLQGYLGKVSEGVTIDKISLVSPPDEWPPTIRLEYTVGTEHRVDESGWEGVGHLAGSTRAEADIWFGITMAGLDEQGLC